MNLSTVLRAMCEFAKKVLLPINALVVNQPNSTQHSSAFTISMQLNTCCRFRTLDLTYSLCLTSFAGETLGIRWDGMGFRARVGQWDGHRGNFFGRWALGRRNQYWANTGFESVASFILEVPPK